MATYSIQGIKITKTGLMEMTPKCYSVWLGVGYLTVNRKQFFTALSMYDGYEGNVELSLAEFDTSLNIERFVPSR